MPVLLLLLLFSGLDHASAGEIHTLRSPDESVVLSVEMPAPSLDSRPTWSVGYRGEILLKNCGLGLETKEAGDLLAGARLLEKRTRAVEQRIRVLFGKADDADDLFREARFVLEDRDHRRVEMVFRCYNDAVAFRYELPVGPGAGSVTITN